MPELATYTGTIILDNNRTGSFLDQASYRFLLTVKPLAIDAFSWQQVTDSLRLYSTTPGIDNTAWALHIVDSLNP